MSGKVTQTWSDIAVVTTTFYNSAKSHGLYQMSAINSEIFKQKKGL